MYENGQKYIYNFLNKYKNIECSKLFLMSKLKYTSKCEREIDKKKESGLWGNNLFFLLLSHDVRKYWQRWQHLYSYITFTLLIYYLIFFINSKKIGYSKINIWDAKMERKKKKKSIFLENWKIKKRVGDLFVARKHDFISCTEENSEATRNCIPRRRIMVKHAFPSYTSFMWKKEFINMGESGPTTSPHMPHTYTRTVNIYTLNSKGDQITGAREYHIISPEI